MGICFAAWISNSGVGNTAVGLDSKRVNHAISAILLTPTYISEILYQVG